MENNKDSKEQLSKLDELLIFISNENKKQSDIIKGIYNKMNKLNHGIKDVLQSDFEIGECFVEKINTEYLIFKKNNELLENILSFLETTI